MPQGVSTGERLTGEVVQAIIAAASLGNSKNRIARITKANYRSVEAIIQRESQTIADRKEALQPIFARIAQRGAERIEREIDTAPFTAAVIATGVSVDKLVALTPPADQTPSQHLHLHLAPQDISGTFNSLLSSLSDKAKSLRSSSTPLTHPDCKEVILDSPPPKEAS